MRYAVVVVNWNGADDTLACIASFVALPADNVIVVVDNGSSDDSVARIEAQLLRFDRDPWRGAGRELPRQLPGARAMLIEAGENLGFAAGANLGLRAALAANCAVSIFLNNDTVVEGGALDSIVQRLAGDPNCFACLPMLVVHGSDTIWNCGGAIYSMGLRRYHLADRPRSEGTARGEIRCSFFTGCCFAVHTADFLQRRGFCERFFFGEEDFELALWMKDHGLGAVCLTSAVVQHKVSASFNAAAGSRPNAKVFIYYLNRFIHMRLRFGALRWWLWVAAYLPYAAALLWSGRRLRAGEVARFLGRLVACSRVMERVTRADFEAVMTGKIAW